MAGTSTSSQHKNRGRSLAFAGYAFLLIAALAVIVLINKQRAAAPIYYGYSRAKIGNTDMLLEILNTPQKRQQGLSGRLSLHNNQGMLFVFDTSARQCIWMKDMNFNIDIVWADADKTVTHIEPDISPQTYPRTFCGSQEPSLYVIELNSGAVAHAGLKTGDKISF